jgi:hypothetical protein
VHRRPLERRLDLHVLRGHVLRGLVGEEERELVDELAEDLRRRVAVTQEAQLVLDERMIDDDEVLGGHAHPFTVYAG